MDYQNFPCIIPCSFMVFRNFSHQKQYSAAAEMSVRGVGAFPLGGRLVPVHSPPHPSHPQICLKWIKCHASVVLTTTFKFAFWMKNIIRNIIRKPLLIFSVNKPKGSPSDQHVLYDPRWKAAHYWAGGGIIRVKQNVKEAFKNNFPIQKPSKINALNFN